MKHSRPHNRTIKGSALWLAIDLIDGSTVEGVAQNDLLFISDQINAGVVLIEEINHRGTARTIPLSDVRNIDVLGRIGWESSRKRPRS